MRFAVLILACLAVTTFAVECTLEATRTCDNANTPPMCTTVAAPIVNKETCCHNCRPCTETERNTCMTGKPAPPKCTPGTNPTLDGCCPSCTFCNEADKAACSTDIPKCAADAKPTYTGCCPSCKFCTDADRTTCSTNIPKCALDQKPTFTNCCPSCSLCNSADFATCANTATPICGAQEVPQKNGCCMSCRVACECKLEVPTCTGDAKPTYNAETCCPSCKPAGGVVNPCTEAQMTACKTGYAALPTCLAGVLPTRITETCCQSCKIAYVNPCEGKADACRAMIPTLPECGADTKPTFDPATCCQNCKAPAPPVDARPVEGKCTAEAFAKCQAETPVCTDGQEQVRIADTCCPNCKRAESATYCTPTSVAKCLDTVQECAADVRPAVLPGECCVTCRPPMPKCDPACGDRAICVPTKVEGQDKPVPACRAKLPVCVKIVAKTAEIKATLKGMTKEQARNFVIELVNRFCEKNENVERCAKYKNEIDNLSAESFDTTKEDAVDFCMAVAGARQDAAASDKPAGFGFRLFAEDSSAALINDAMKDPGTASAGFEVSETDSGSAFAAASGSPALVAAMAAGLLVVQMM